MAVVSEVVEQRRITPVLVGYIPMLIWFVSAADDPVTAIVPEKVGAAAVLTVRLAAPTVHRPSPVAPPVVTPIR